MKNVFFCVAIVYLVVHSTCMSGVGCPRQEGGWALLGRQKRGQEELVGFVVGGWFMVDGRWMMDAKKSSELYLYEALELRGEYDARIDTIKSCLKGSPTGRRGSLWGGDDHAKRRPSPDFSVSDERAALRTLEFKRRKLNSAIQKANFEREIVFDGQAINLLEALDLRKALNSQLAELKMQVVAAAYQTVIYKEDRDIVEESDASYTESRDALDVCRRAFRDLNRKLRLASFETRVAFQDE